VGLVGLMDGYLEIMVLKMYGYLVKCDKRIIGWKLSMISENFDPPGLEISI